MGKYSLENYCSYETYKIRPKQLPVAPSNTGRGQVDFLKYSWKELEPERGSYDISRVVEEMSKAQNQILVIGQEAPSWVKEKPEEYFSHLIRRIGSLLKNKKEFIGVVVPVSDSIRIWDAYIEAFDGTTLFAALEDEPFIRYLKDKGVPFGIIVTCSEDNWLDCCENFAKHQLQNTWQQMPVVLKITDQEAGPHIRREYFRWHAAFSNLPLDIGYCLTIRRLTYPKIVAGGGALPLRFWYVNNGSAPCYQEITLKLQLVREKTAYELPLQIDQRDWMLGDITHNEILPLPDLKDGIYQLSVGLFFADKSPVWLDLQANEERGYYKLGTIEVNNSLKTDLKYAWDSFYPDGYYPLEDPQAPN